MENTWYIFGVIFGIIVSIIISMLVGKKFNTDGKARTEYDERQQIVRGKGYKYAFWTMTIAIGILVCLESFDVKIPVDYMVVHFSIFIAGGFVLMVYSIWNNAYWGINNKQRNYTLFFGIMGLINLYFGVESTIEGTMIKDGVITHHFINYLCAILLFAAMITLAIRAIVDKKEAADEES